MKISSTPSRDPIRLACLGSFCLSIENNRNFAAVAAQRARNLCAGSLLIGLCTVGLWGCGSASSQPTSTIGERTSNQLTAANVAVFASYNATAHLVSSPNDILRAKKLLKPLIVANALKVNSSYKVTGALVANLLDELDNTTPGLTTQGANGEQHLNVPAVNRFLRYADKEPQLIFEPEVTKAVRQMDKLLHDKPRDLQLGPNLGDSESYLKQAQKEADPFWPMLAKQLVSAQSSLR